MKILFLLRHAKALPGTSGLRDFDRPLSDDGRRQAERIGKYFKEQNSDLDLVLSSTAPRARETTELFMRAAESAIEVNYDARIYEASTQQLVEVVSAIQAQRNRVLLVGHNPGLEELLQRLTGQSRSMTTGALAKIDLETSAWIENGLQGNLDWLVTPSEVMVD